MNTSFSRPSLGINQSSLFQASNDLAICSLSRSEFAKDPNSILSKYEIPLLVSENVDITQKTSEICTPAVVVCFVAVAVAAGFFLAAVAIAGVAAGVGAAAAVVAAGHCHLKFSGSWDDFCASASPLRNDNYIGLV